MELESHSHFCRYDYPPYKCLEMGCQVYFSHLKDLLAQTCSYLEQSNDHEADAYLLKIEYITKCLSDFQILFSEGPVFDCQQNLEYSTLHPEYLLTVCAWCHKPIQIQRYEGRKYSQCSHGMCMTCIDALERYFLNRPPD